MQNYYDVANAIRILSVDAIHKANSGHPGAPLGMAELATTLWLKHLNFYPQKPQWLNRDRVIISNGHASMLLYSILHLTGYDITIEDIKQFRQLNSKTPGHPEYGRTEGVETTTGPLGQGFANAVGMALAEKNLSAKFNKPNFPIIDHYTYVFIGDGCLMEGISYEASSLAGTWRLNKLIAIYDSNGISIDGKITNWFTENVELRFKAANWHVIQVLNGHDIKEIDTAITLAKQNQDKPTLIICHTVIGKGVLKKEGTASAHGTPFNKIEVEELREYANWPIQEEFKIPDAVMATANHLENGLKVFHKWEQLFLDYKNKFPELAQQLESQINKQLPDSWQDIKNNALIFADSNLKPIATRNSSLIAINYFAQYFDELLGGSADLTPSNATKWEKATVANEQNNYLGSYYNFGVREFGMSAIINGIYLYGGFRPFCGTFLTFSDYARNAVRLAALMHITPIFIYTHDSIFLGEDGPTHQPVEHLASLRLIPNLVLWRPADIVETFNAYINAFESTSKPTCLALSRQNLPHIKRDNNTINSISCGGYILYSNLENDATVDILILATGSEVHLAIELYNYLLTLKDNFNIQLVSLPATQIFDLQSLEYQNKVIPKNALYKIAIEAGVKDSWYKYLGTEALIHSIDTFGDSATSEDLAKYFDFNIVAIKHKVAQYLNLTL